MTRPRDLILEAWADRLGINYDQWSRPDHRLPNALLCQLSACRSDEARRLLLGMSEQVEDTGHRPIVNPWQRIKELAAKEPAGERIGVDVRGFLERKPASRRRVA